MIHLRDFSHISMGTRKFKLLFIEKLMNSDNQRLRGEIDLQAGTLSIDPELAEDQAAITMLHEVCHAIEDMFDLDNNCDEEQRVTRYAQGFAVFLTNNPEIQKLFSGEE